MNQKACAFEKALRYEKRTIRCARSFITSEKHSQGGNFSTAISHQLFKDESIFLDRLP
jgi:hypothetical protein